MSSHRQRLAAIHSLAKTSGRTPAQVASELLSTWPLEAGERYMLEAACAPEREVQRAVVWDTDDQCRAHARRHAELRAQNPFAAAGYMNQHADAIIRGRELDSNNGSDPGPQAA